MTERDRTDVDGSLRWDFVTDPPTRLLAELQAARAHFHRGRLIEAGHAARRLLRHVADRLTPSDADAEPEPRMAIIGADGRAVLALARHSLGRSEGAHALDESVAEYRALLADGHELRPPSLADYGMVLAVSGRATDAVDPLVRALEAGEDVASALVRDAAGALLSAGLAAESVRLLRAAQERYPWDPALAIDLAHACERLGDVPAAAAAHVAAAALCAEATQYEASLTHFRRAGELVPGHPLAALGHCQALLAVGELAPALTALDELSRRRPDLAGSYAVRALALAQLGEAETALRTVHDGLTDFPEDPWLLDTRVRLLRRAGDSESALAAVDQALQVDGTDRTWRGVRAELLLERGEDVEEALQSLRELVASAPHGSYAAVRLAVALRRVDRRGEALDVVARARGDHPDAPDLVTQEVELLTELGRLQEAVAQARAAQRQGITGAGLHVALAEALLALGSVDAAFEAADVAVRADPGSARVYRVLGLAHRRAGRVEEGVAALRTAVDLGADDEETRSGLTAGLVELARKKSDDPSVARAYLDSALALEPENAAARRMLTDLLRSGGEYTDALQHADLGLRYHEDDAALLASRGLVQEGLGRRKEAEAGLRHALALDPALTWARAELGELLRTRGRFREALVELARAAEEDPGAPWILASKAATEYALDMFDDAERSIDRALDTEPNYTWARGVRAILLAETDDLLGAQQELARVLEQDDTLGWCWVLKGWLALFEEGAADPGRSDAARRALEAFERARKQDGADVGALVGLGEAQTLLGELEDGRRTFTAAVAVARRQRATDANVQAGLGWSLLRLKEYEEAVDALLRALAIDPTLTTPAFEVGLALLCAGKNDVGMEELRHAVSRTSSIHHEGRRRAVYRQLTRDLEALAGTELRDRTDEVREARAMLGRMRSRDDGFRSGGLQMSPA